MNCEFCKKMILESELVHGLRFGTVDAKAELFLPARESAPTIICKSCGSMVLKIVYSRHTKASVCPHP